MRKTRIQYLRLLPAAVLLGVVCLGCSDFKNAKIAENGGPVQEEEREKTPQTKKAAPAPAAPQPAAPAAPEVWLTEEVPPVDFSKYTIKKGPRSNERIHINPLGRLTEVFNDSNKFQYAYAERLGIDPVSDISQAYATKRPIVKITSNEYYEVAELSHSFPYLVPEAATLLKLIGRNFVDSLASRGADGYRIMVTSVLRTPHHVKKLRRINRNAVDSSTHKFATTFDISYSKFACADTLRTINQEDLKNLLAEVLADLRRQNRCLVKYEVKSPCFHITATR